MACAEIKGFWNKNLGEFNTLEEVEPVDDQSGAFIPCKKLHCDGINNVYAYKNSLENKYFGRVLDMYVNADDHFVDCIVRESKGKMFIDSILEEKASFKKGDVVISKDEFIASYEKPEDTLGIVVSYNPDNDYLVLGSVHPEKYAIPHTFSCRGEFYRLATDKEIKDYGLLEPVPEKENTSFEVGSIVNALLNGADVREALCNKTTITEDSSYRTFYLNLVDKMVEMLDAWGDYIGDAHQFELMCKKAAGDAWKKFADLK